jgi:imidazolonepropionase-like amidohydrolase
VGVYPHGDNVRELELMHEYGMSRSAVLQAATAGNASIFGLERLGRIAVGKLADIVVVEGDPEQDLAALYRVRMVLKNGEIVGEEKTWN